MALFTASGCDMLRRLINPEDGEFYVRDRAHLRELLNFADPDSINLFSLGTSKYMQGWYNTEFNGQYKLVDDPQAQDGKAVEIHIDSGTSSAPWHDLVLIDVTAMGITIGEIGEIYVDYKMMDGDFNNNFWPRIVLNTNESGAQEGNVIGSWRADGSSKYASAAGNTNYALITAEEIAAHYGTDLQAGDYLQYIGFQYIAHHGQYATFRLDSITILTKEDVALRG